MTVDARPTIRPANALEVVASNDGDTRRARFFLDSTVFPKTFTVTPTGRQGALHLDVTAIQELEDDRLVRARGTTTATIAPGRLTEAHILLEPSDFVVNTTRAGDQATTRNPDGRSGRQIATAADGSFLVGFISRCDPICEVRARWFDADASPRPIAGAPDSGDFLVALAGEADPTVATALHEDRVALAWAAILNNPLRIEVRAAVLTAAAVIAGDVVVATGSQTSPVGDPHITALGSGELLVTWLQGGGNPVIRGRLLDGNGVPVINPVTGDDRAFDIGAAVPDAAPALAATGQGRGFVVTWTDGGNLHARFFDDDGLPRSPDPVALTSYGDGVVEGARVAWDGDAAVVAWSAAAEGDPALTRGALLVGRFLPPEGSPVGAPLILASETAGSTGIPDVAVRPDGMAAAVWHGCDAAGDGSGCGIHMRFVDPAGMRAGEPFVAATTTAGDQRHPSIAATRDAFLVVWTDHSTALPDTSGSAVRARVIYSDTSPGMLPGT